MGDLTGGMHTGVGTPGRAQPKIGPEHRRQRLLEQARDRALIGLSSPAREICSVVCDIKPKTNEPAISVDGGLVVQR